MCKIILKPDTEETCRPYRPDLLRVLTFTWSSYKSIYFLKTFFLLNQPSNFELFELYLLLDNH